MPPVGFEPTISPCDRPQTHALDRAATATGNTDSNIRIFLAHAQFFTFFTMNTGRSKWPRGLKRGSAADSMTRLWVRIPPGAWISVCCDCWVLSGRGFCDELIIRPEESYRLWCVVVCDLETSSMRRPWPTGGCLAVCLSRQKQINKKRRLFQ